MAICQTASELDACRVVDDADCGDCGSENDPDDQAAGESAQELRGNKCSFAGEVSGFDDRSGRASPRRTRVGSCPGLVGDESGDLLFGDHALFGGDCVAAGLGARSDPGLGE